MHPIRTSLSGYALLVALCLFGQTNAAEISVKTVVITIHASAPRESLLSSPPSSKQRHSSTLSPSPPPSASFPPLSSFSFSSSRVNFLSNVDVPNSATVTAPPQATVSLMAATAHASTLTVLDASDASTTRAHPMVRPSQEKQATAIFATLNAPSSTINSSAVNVSANTANPTNATQPLDPVYDRMVKAHGALMYLAWGVFAPVGALSARYIKRTTRGEKMWLPIHIYLFLACFVLNMIAFGLIYLASSKDHFDYTSNGFHPILGLAIVVALFIQTALGYLINHLYNPVRTKTPIWDQTFFVFGSPPLARQHPPPRRPHQHPPRYYPLRTRASFGYGGQQLDLDRVPAVAPLARGRRCLRGGSFARGDAKARSAGGPSADWIYRLGWRRRRGSHSRELVGRVYCEQCNVTEKRG
ncbi:hypothetical protein BC830DRAFT_20595 [Chytriomyces sp. MP71]|nr:hypothetical protein BC830DRAFT_20595 [Chytriomyces sp. MP71]